MRILLIDDDPGIRESLGEALEDFGHHVTCAASAEEGLDLCEDSPFPLVITDMRMPGKSGLELLTQLKKNPKTTQCDVVILTGHGDLESAVRALRSGAYDYVNKPINARELAAVVERSAEHQALLEENRELTSRFDEKVQEATATIREDLSHARNAFRHMAGLDRIIAVSPEMQRLIGETGLYHKDPFIPVLIEGETGTGKEVIARLIHHGTEGIDTPFVDLNCSALNTDLFESELFGYAPGAFTGGQKEGGRGKLELAGQGTLFLDEIGDMPPALQPKLLRVLQERTFYRVGGTKKIAFEARIICATNRDLAGMVEAGTFRRDLYHRLYLGHVCLPPLRERKADIAPLAEYFLDRACERRRKPKQRLSSEAQLLLENQDWTGNIRELENAIERAVLTTDTELLETRHFMFLKPSTSSSTAIAAVSLPSLSPAAWPLPEEGLDLESLTNTLILRALEKFDGNKSAAAPYLGLSRHALRRRLEKMGQQ